MKLGTHNGPFHADEVFATAFLLNLYEDAEIIRTRKEDILQTCDIVYDVGRGKYDHHTRDKEYRENEIPYAASGLIWRDFGREILRKEGVDDPAVEEEFFNEVDEVFIQPLDALDNGINIEKSMPILDIAYVVKLMNPAWDADESEEESFWKAVTFAKSVFYSYLNKLLSSHRAYPFIQRAFEAREVPEILILETGCPWGKALTSLDEQNKVLFVITPRDNGQFTVQGVRSEPGSFAVRKNFPDSWAGLEGEELERATHVPGSIFCHSGLWLAVADSLAGAVQLAKLAIQA
ncbi:MYG1 family protein [Aneurinibacillus sp. Ricciae_BoGa-3]|uniref:MYG1 family protein n=1 Tax=Aneurinibacillus sp. Ricciae_BoGa-3 TaxID=3022697 RepID=UPI00234079E7|nr:MYG1 family protein [Aneurinibacillus sp. Ricciae_BoGa-3]WCK53178.1 MYG1 family protein [Aneurinibacillus sp. Ricciae_BoGa-3]